MPPEQLLQAFKNAALSVTNLYKSAVTDQNNSRAAGYQDALDDLLRFLDSENLGLQDGEGWRVRQWATERYDQAARQPSPESDDAKPINTDGAREETVQEQETASSDVGPTDVSNDTEQLSRRSEERQTRHDSAPPIFTFTAGQSQADTDAMQVGDDAVNQASHAETSNQRPIQVQLINRQNRGAHRGNNIRHGRSALRSTTSTAGAKRKIQQVPDFFDIANITFNNDRDAGPSGKRNRVA
jgi:hypothetical protein